MIHYYVPSKKALVFGYSMGGYIAMAFGAKYPELCRYAQLRPPQYRIAIGSSLLTYSGTAQRLDHRRRWHGHEEGPLHARVDGHLLQTSLQQVRHVMVLYFFIYIYLW